MLLASPDVRGLLLFSVILVLGVLFVPVDGQVVQWDIEKRIVPTRLRRRADSTYEEVITNEKGVGGYFATATIGTPGQNVTLQLDTASSDIWVPFSGAAVCRGRKLSGEKGCYLGSCEWGMPITSKTLVMLTDQTVDPKPSKTFDAFSRDTFEISYIDASFAKGHYFTDTFEISGAKVKNLTMGLGVQTDISYGLLGVGYAINEASITTAGFKYPNLPIAMVNEGLINSVAYSLWLNDLGASTGNILFGGIDTSKFLGDMARLSILKDKEINAYDHFVVPLTSLEATSPSGTDILSTSDWPLEVVLDSGTTLSYLPYDIAKMVWDEVGATYNPEVDMAVLPCSHFEHPGYFSFGFAGEGGPRINITMDELVIDLTDGQAPEFSSGDHEGERVCQFGIQRGIASPYTLGDTFLRSAYVVYDLENNEVGIAATDFNSTKTNIVAFESKGAKIPSATLARHQAQTLSSPQATGQALKAADGFQDRKNKDKEGKSGDKDEEDAGSPLQPLHGYGMAIMLAVLTYTALA